MKKSTILGISVSSDVVSSFKYYVKCVSIAPTDWIVGAAYGRASVYLENCYKDGSLTLDEFHILEKFLRNIGFLNKRKYLYYRRKLYQK